MDTRFLGGLPDPEPRQYMGRITIFSHDPTSAWSRGAIVLPSSTAIHWIAYSDGVERNLPLFDPSVRVIVTGCYLAGDVYLTGIRPATDTEWQDAVDTLNQLPARTPQPWTPEGDGARAVPAP